MKKIIVYLLVLTAFSSCSINEDLDDCPQGIKCLLHFVYYNKDGKEEFAANVEKADVYFYNQQGRFVTARHLSKSELARFQGVELDLEPGTYTAVGWGNALSEETLTEDSRITGIDNSFLYYSGEAGTDKLFYAPKSGLAGTSGRSDFTFTVPEAVSYENTLEFTTAYRQINIYVSGYESVVGNPEEQPLSIELEGMPGEHDFRFGHLNQQHRFAQKTSPFTTGEETIHGAFLTTGLFGDDTPGRIILKNSVTGEILRTIELSEFIKQNDINLDDPYNRLIEIHISFVDGNVNVSIEIPDWDLKPILPGLISE